MEVDLSQETAKVELGIKGLHVELQKVTGKVLVDTLLDFSTFNGFLFKSLFFSFLRVLISDLNLMMLSE